MGVASRVQDTAFLAAALRAAENRRPSPRLSDPFAELFVTAAGRSGRGHHERIAAGGDAVIDRARLVDELLVDALGRHDSRDTVLVNLGAGLCSRPYRLELTGCVLVVEFDDENVLTAKERVLREFTPSQPVHRVGLDLRDTQRVARALADLGVASRPVILVTEGLLPYLSVDEIRVLSRTLADTSDDTRWFTDVVSTSSAHAMRQLARGAGTDMDIHGLDTLDPVEAGRWTAVDYRVLPSAPVRFRSPESATRTASSRMVVDGVVALKRT